MQLQSLRLTNFKAVEEASLSLNGKSTVFFGVNGVGKSTVLRAVSLILSDAIYKFTGRIYDQKAKREGADIAHGKDSYRLEAQFIFKDGELATCTREVTKDNITSTNEAFCNKFKLSYLEDDSSDMPIFVTYSTHRMVYDINFTKQRMDRFDKKDAFDHAISAISDFSAFFNWFYSCEIALKEGNERARYFLNAIHEAVTEMLDGVTDLRLGSEDELIVTKNGLDLSADELSDGEKCTLALFGDLARRLVLANAQKEDPLQGEGIVLIDEIELHMHTLWQRRVLSTLCRLFPNIQFLITTHSPQVLGEIGDEFNIFAVMGQNRNVSFRPVKPLKGWDANYILEEFLGTSHINQETKTLIRRMYDAIGKRELATAEALVDQLEKMTDPANADVVKARILIGRGRRKQ
jgi:predicted ATP-binding protein involved in virulence